MSPIETIALARLNAIYDDERADLSQFRDLDVRTSVAIAEALLEENRQRMAPATCHVLFCEQAPSDHPQQCHYSKLADFIQKFEEIGLREAVNMAITLYPEKESLLDIRDNLAIDFAADAAFRAIRLETNCGSEVSAINLFGHLAEAFTERLINAANGEFAEAPSGPMPNTQNLVSSMVRRAKAHYRRQFDTPELPEGVVQFPAPAAVQ